MRDYVAVHKEVVIKCPIEQDFFEEIIMERMESVNCSLLTQREQIVNL